MTNAEAVETAVKRALDNGYKPFGNAEVKQVYELAGALVFMVIVKGSKNGPVQRIKNLSSVIFSHDFAEALFGRHFIANRVRADGVILSYDIAYIHHLKRMAEATERMRPIYLRHWLEGL